MIMPEAGPQQFLKGTANETKQAMETPDHTVSGDRPS